MHSLQTTFLSPQRESTADKLWATLLAIALCTLGCKSEPDKAAVVSEPTGHEEMRRILGDIAVRTATEHLYIGNREATRLREEIINLPKEASAFDHAALLSLLAQEELNFDELGTAILHLKEAVDIFTDVYHPDPNVKNLFKNRLMFSLGVAYMRLGETQNCCRTFTGESCIVPIQGTGIHQNAAGSNKAIECFLDVLSRPTLVKAEQVKVHEPARWLLNIAYMTLGRYPQDVPEEHLIPPSFFESEVEFPRFKNIYPTLGLNTFNLSGGAIIDDFTGDGYLDIVTSTYDSTGQTQFFQNDADGSFRERTAEIGLAGFFGGLTMVQADYDNDGDIDIFIPRGAWLKSWGQHPNSLLRNDGEKFTDVSFEAGLGEVHYPTKTAAWADYDNDGDLDLYVGNESTKGEIEAPAQLFRNNGDGTFTDVAAEAGIRENLFAMGAVWGDYNNDRYPDLFVSNGGPNRLYRNNRDGTFTDVATELGVSKPHASFPAWFWDYNNDGVVDLYVGCSSGHVGIQALQLRGGDVSSLKLSIRQLKQEVELERAALYQGNGSGGFSDVAEAANVTFPTLPMGANFGDLNNDGFLDFYLGTGDIHYSELMPNLMYLNQAGAKFVDVTMAGGFGHLQKGHSVSFADLDNDGDQDVYMQMGGAYPNDKFNDSLFENPGFDNHWIGVRLDGKKSNRSGIGARIRAVIKEDGVERSVYRHVNSGGSFGCNPLRQTLGLGKAERIERLEVYWPTTDETQVFEDVPVDQVIRIEESKSSFTQIKLKPLTFRKTGS
jgi:hypothetical protein